MKLPFFTTLIIAATTACSGEAARTEAEAREASDAFITQEYSMGNISSFTITGRETENTWTFTYDIPDEKWTGGPLFVTVDKKTGKVVDHRGSQ